MKRIIQSFGTFLLLSLPCVAQQPLPFLQANDVILFQGDSITDGGRLRTGNDYNHIMGQNYAYILAARIGYESPTRNLNFVNRGDGGDRISDLAARWQDDTIAMHPNLLSILIGVNDTLSSRKPAETVSEFEEIYDRLLGQTIIALPNTKIVLCQPFVLPVGKHKETYAQDIIAIRQRQQVVLRLGAKYHLPVINYQAAFDQALSLAPAEHWSWDGIHPTYAGHGLMAKEWLAGVDAFWGR